MTGREIFKFTKALILLGILFLGIGYLVFLVLFGVGFSLWDFLSNLPEPPETVAELSPISLFSLIVFGCTFGVYMPMIFIHLYRQNWHNWPIQTKAYFIFAAIFLSGIFS